MSDDWNVTGSGGLAQTLPRTGFTAIRKIPQIIFVRIMFWYAVCFCCHSMRPQAEQLGLMVWNKKAPDGPKKLPARAGKCPR